MFGPGPSWSFIAPIVQIIWKPGQVMTNDPNDQEDHELHVGL